MKFNYLDRAVLHKGIYYNGFLYATIPKLIGKRAYILEDHKDYLIVSDYSRISFSPVGVQYKVIKIGLGRPTNDRINNLKSALGV